MYPHRIRLRGPWECEPLSRRGDAAAATLPPPCFLTLPCRWEEGELADFAGRVRFRRRFGAPTRVGPGEHLWLTFGGTSDARVWLNTDYLGEHHGAGPFEFEVTGRLRPRNELAVEVDVPPTDSGTWGDVALEVRRPAFLRGVRFRPSVEDGLGRLEVSGQVLGTSSRPLEVRLTLDGQPLGVAVVPFHVEEHAFRLEASKLEVQWNDAGGDSTAQLYLARAELLSGSSSWYVVDEQVEFKG